MKIHENYKNLCGTKDDEADKPTKKNKHTSVLQLKKPLLELWEVYINFI
jgi:hypothetical protein